MRRNSVRQAAQNPVQYKLMKKLIVTFASIALATSFIGCGDAAVDEEPPNDDMGPEPTEEGAGDGGDGGSEE